MCSIAARGSPSASQRMSRVPQKARVNQTAIGALRGQTAAPDAADPIMHLAELIHAAVRMSGLRPLAVLRGDGVRRLPGGPRLRPGPVATALARPRGSRVRTARPSSPRTAWTAPSTAPAPIAPMASATGCCRSKAPSSSGSAAAPTWSSPTCRARSIASAGARSRSPSTACSTACSASASPCLAKADDPVAGLSFSFLADDNDVRADRP